MRRPRLETFDLNLLRIFDALFRHGSVNLAAGEIGVSPSAISHALGRLRQNFDDELFVKGPEGMIPTACAAELAGPIGTALRQVRLAFGPQEFEPQTAVRQFKVRANHYIARLILPDVIKRMRAEAPGVRLVVDCDYSKGIADELDSALIDVALGTFANLPDRLYSEVLLTDSWRWVLRADHPVLAGPITTETLMKQPLLVVASTEVISSMEGTVSEAGLERILVPSRKFLKMGEGGSRYVSVTGSIVINSADAVPAILAASDLVSLLPARLSLTNLGGVNLTTLPFEDEDSGFDHRLVWHQRSKGDPAIEWLCSIVRLAVSDMKGRESET